MAITYSRKKQKQHHLLYTVITAVLICAVFLGTVNIFYTKAENEAYETLHLQTKQIKDDLTLQLLSDRENLSTMANFASKLYANGESYNLMFDSFKPIGLFSRIGILNSDNTFITKDGTYDLNGKLSFYAESIKGEHVTGRTISYSIPGEEVVRSGVPIVVDGRTVGIIYGIIRMETINKKYGDMAKELDAQLFVYDKDSKKFIIDTINQIPGELTDLKTREYKDGFSYLDFLTNDKGFSSFKSLRTGEDLYVHYSTIEDFDWGIMLARYETQVFAETDAIFRLFLFTFCLMMFVIVAYICIVLLSERNRINATAEASGIRKLLLEVNQNHENIFDALKNIQNFSRGRSAFFADTDGEDYYYIQPALKGQLLSGEEKNYFISELFCYAAALHNVNKATVSIMRIVPNKHLAKTNLELYRFSKEHDIREVSFAMITNKNNHISILGTINPKKGVVARSLLEDIAICFSIAIFNKKHLNKTELAATTDALTGVLNRVAYKKDILILDQEKPKTFSCIYIDVNELHIMNNKFGHAAGDEMLIYIANTLKEVFFGQSIYRMGGDEFLVFTKAIPQEQLKKDIESFMELLKPKGYHVAIGLSFRKQSTNCEEMVREAEIRMYEAKAQYYQNKEHSSVASAEDKSYVQTKTGIREIDTMLSILNEHYNGIYRVSLKTDNAHRILMPSYLGYNEDESHFSKLFTKYIDDIVHPDFHRAIMSFLNYDAIKRQLMEGVTPQITYNKVNGETVILSVYPLGKDHENFDETLWVFAKD